MSYGQKITELRKKSQMTQVELGEKLNVTSQAVSKWENDLSEPDLDTINRICELFNISANEFFGTTQKADTENISESKTDTAAIEGKPAETPVEPQKSIVAHCERCNKPLHEGEYKVLRHKESKSEGDTQVYETIQEILCNSCAEKRLKEEADEKKRKKLLAEQEERKEMNRGFIWGTVGAVVALIVALVLTFDKTAETGAVVCAYVAIYGMFAMISQIIWDNSVNDCFFFFLKSFRMPGVIFEFSIDGFIWAICVKIFLSILSIILSILLFIVGVIVTMAYSMVAFPFGLKHKIDDIKEAA